MNKRTIFVADHLFEKKNFFQYKKSKLRFNIVFNSSLKPINDQFLIKYFKNNQRIVGVVAGLEKYNKFTLAYQKNLKVISRVGVGVDSLDLNGTRYLHRFLLLAYEFRKKMKKFFYLQNF